MKRPTIIIIALSVAVALAVGLAVPLSLKMKKHESTEPPSQTTQTNTPTPSREKAGIIVPLYVYPTSTSWDPLFAALSSYPSIPFIIIINPSNGPGSSPLASDSAYATCITRIKSNSNAVVVGYVFTSYASRSVSDVSKDIARYASWNKDWRPQGIFFDETPDTGHVEYMTNITKMVKDEMGGIVVHNPGTIPEEALLAVGQDVTVVVEDTEAGFYETVKGFGERNNAAGFGVEKKKSAAVLHGCERDVENLVRDLKKYFGYIYVTEFTGDEAYTKFGKNWDDLLPELLKN